MWRQSPFSEHEDQDDQSISDDESDQVIYNHNYLADVMCLYQHRKKEQLPVALEHEVSEGGKLVPNSYVPELNIGATKAPESHEKLGNLSSVVETGMHEFQREEHGSVKNMPGKESSSGSGEDKISDEENNNHTNLSFIPEATVFQQRQTGNSFCDNHLLSNEACTWSTVLKEAKELVHLGKPSRSLPHASTSEVRRFPKGSRGKSKFRFLIRPLSNKDENSSPSCMDENEKLPEFPKVDAQLEVLGHRSSESSIAELLEGLQENNGLLPWTSNMDGKTKAIRSCPARKRSVVHLRNRFVDNEDPLEPMDGCTSADEAQEADQSSGFSLHPQLFKEEISCPSFKSENQKLSEFPEVDGQLEALDHRSLESSIAELLEGLQEKTGPLPWTSNTDGKTRTVRSRFAGKRSVAHLGDRFLDNEDPLEPMDGSTSSGDEAHR